MHVLNQILKKSHPKKWQWSKSLIKNFFLSARSPTADTSFLLNYLTLCSKISLTSGSTSSRDLRTMLLVPCTVFHKQNVDLHWLPLYACTEFYAATLCYHVVHGLIWVCVALPAWRVYLLCPNQFSHCLSYQTGEVWLSLSFFLWPKYLECPATVSSYRWDATCFLVWTLTYLLVIGLPWLFLYTYLSLCSFIFLRLLTVSLCMLFLTVLFISHSLLPYLL